MCTSPFTHKFKTLDNIKRNFQGNRLEAWLDLVQYREGMASCFEDGNGPSSWGGDFLRVRILLRVISCWLDYKVRLPAAAELQLVTTSRLAPRAHEVILSVIKR